MFLGWIAAFGWGTNIVKAFSSLYIGYGPSFVGGLIGGAWGFADGATGALVFVLAYNAFLKKPEK